MKYVKEFRAFFSKQPAFSTKDAFIFLKRKGINKGYFYFMLHHMLSRGELKRISRSYYTFHSDVSIVGFAFKPFYYGLYDALSIHNLWEQETNPVVITVRRIRTGLREFAGRNYVVRRIASDMFFGYEYTKYSGFWIPVSSIEKTLIDFIYFREPISAELAKIFKAKIDRKKLSELAHKINTRKRKRILNRLEGLLGLRLNF